MNSPYWNDTYTAPRMSTVESDALRYALIDMAQVAAHSDTTPYNRQRLEWAMERVANAIESATGERPER